MTGLNLRCYEHIVKAKLVGMPDQPGIAADIFASLAEQGISIELIIASATGKGKGDISIALHENELPAAAASLEQIKTRLGARELVTDQSLALLSFSGEALTLDPGLTARIFKVLGTKGVNLQMISQSLNSISFLIPRDKLADSLTTIRESFEVTG